MKLRLSKFRLLCFDSKTFTLSLYFSAEEIDMDRITGILRMTGEVPARLK